MENTTKKQLKNCTVSKPHSFYDENGFLEAVSVDRASSYFSVSTRRIRKMLADGVLKGTKHGQAWRIDYPYVMRFGSRGPVAKRFQTLTALQKPVRNKKPYQNQKLKKGE